MKILAPISSPDEVEMLAASGAEELYCGVVPREWMDAYTGTIWLNRRSPIGANLGSVESLAELVHLAHGHGIPVALALNAPAYSERQLEWVGELARRATAEIGVDALIVSDMALLLTLAERGTRARIHVSSVASALNSEAIALYRELGAARVILPRALSLGEIAALAGAAAAAGGPELEAFILNDGCAFEEGLCHTIHHHRAGAFCSGLTRWSYRALGDGGEDPRPEEQEHLDRNLEDYRRWIGLLNGCGAAPPGSPNGLPPGPCGLCAIPDLERMGIAAIKIVGREASSYRKLMSLKMVKAIADLVRAGASQAEVAARARQVRDAPELCDSGFMCYYRGFAREASRPSPTLEVEMEGGEGG